MCSSCKIVVDFGFSNRVAVYCCHASVSPVVKICGRAHDSAQNSVALLTADVIITVAPAFISFCHRRIDGEYIVIDDVESATRLCVAPSSSTLSSSPSPSSSSSTAAAAAAAEATAAAAGVGTDTDNEIDAAFAEYSTSLTGTQRRRCHCRNV